MIRHLPSIERFRDRQTSSLEPNFSILTRKFFLLFCFSSYDMKIPNARTGSLGHLNPNGFSSLSRQGPSPDEVGQQFAKVHGSKSDQSKLRKAVTLQAVTGIHSLQWYRFFPLFSSFSAID